MIERKFVAEKLKEVEAKFFTIHQLDAKYCSKFEIKRTPLGEKIVIHTSRPGLVVGKKGESIKEATIQLKQKFNLDNLQMEVVEIENPDLDPASILQEIADSFEKFGSKRFKAIGYDALQKAMDAGAAGIEIIISGRGLPSSRAKSWRFYAGYLKKCGDIAISKIAKAAGVANLRSGTIGIKVKIMLPSTMLPDKLTPKQTEIKEGQK